MIGTLDLTIGRVSDMADTPLDPPDDDRSDAESSFELVRRAHNGDPAAQNALCVRYLPRLQRWAQTIGRIALRSTEDPVRQ